MGLFGGDSKSENIVTTTTTTETDNFSDLDAEQIFSDTGNISLLDGGAIDNAFGFGTNTLSSFGENINSVLDFGRDIVTSTGQSTQKSLDTLANLRGTDEGQGTQQIVKMLAIAAVVAAGIFFVSRR